MGVVSALLMRLYPAGLNQKSPMQVSQGGQSPGVMARIYDEQLCVAKRDDQLEKGSLMRSMTFNRVLVDGKSLHTMNHKLHRSYRYSAVPRT